MNVDIKQNGSSIKEHIISYVRDQKICNGIGSFSVVVSNSSPVSFTTWDEITLYENSTLVGVYFVSSITRSLPDSTKTAVCQDGSKRIVDYFIPESYVVDYPTTSKYWIEKFLDESGVSYTFTTSGNGSTVSNFTTLGLMTVYDQLMQLLQTSGWYMYFSTDNEVIIGDLNKNISDIDFSFDRNDVVSIQTSKDDKMLRNRAVVYGGYSVDNNEQIAIDISVNTKWNYSSSDKRAVLVSNSNIDTVFDAINLANIALSEFAKITYTKSVTISGHYDVKLGDVVRLSTNIYNGNGIVTSVGTSLSKDGTFTHIILDERCPRLFGFFNFGGFVYIGTYGAGVWRKNIKYGVAWANYSTGLDNLDVVDLHVSNGYLACVTADGGAYYRHEGDTSWFKVTITDLLTPVDNNNEDEVYVFGSGVDGFAIVSSGIMARSCILDRNTNNISYVCDSYSGYSPPSYSGYYSGSGEFIPSGESRSWVVNYRHDEELNSIPLIFLTNSSLRAFDIETDGEYMYPTISSNLVIDFGSNYDFGETKSWVYSDARQSSNSQVVEDGIESSLDFYGMNKYVEYGNEYSFSLSDVESTGKVIGVYDNVVANMMFTVVSPVGGDDIKILRVYDDTYESEGVTYTYLNGSSYIFPTVGSDYQMLAKFVDSDTYAIYGYSIDGVDLIIKKDILTLSTLGVSTVVLDTIENVDPLVLDELTVNSSELDTLAADDKLVFSTYHWVGLSTEFENIIVIQNVYDIESGTITTDSFSVDLEDDQWIEPGDMSQMALRKIMKHGNNFLSAIICVKSCKGYEWDELGVPHFHENSIIIALFAGSSNCEVELSRTFYPGTERFPASNFLWLGDYKFRGIKYKESNYILAISYYSDIEYEDNVSSDVNTTYYYYINTDNVNTVITESCHDDSQPMYSDGNLLTDLTSTYNVRVLPKDLGFGIVRYLVSNATDSISKFSETNLEILGDIEPTGGDVIYDFMGTSPLENSDKFYVACQSVSDGYTTGIGEYNFSTNTITGFSDSQYVTRYDLYTEARGNFIIRKTRDSAYPNHQNFRVYYYGNSKIIESPVTAALKVDSIGDIEILQTGTLPIKVDISNYSPILTLQDSADTLQSHTITLDGIETVESSITQEDAYDIRYSFITTSGVYTDKRGLYTISGAIMSTDISHLTSSSGIITLGVSGILNHLEITNNFYPDQYFFASLQGSGTSHMFYQKNVDSSIFIDRTYNLPEYEITIIRTDDRL